MSFPFPMEMMFHGLISAVGQAKMTVDHADLHQRVIWASKSSMSQLNAYITIYLQITPDGQTAVTISSSANSARQQDREDEKNLRAIWTALHATLPPPPWPPPSQPMPPPQPPPSQPATPPQDRP